jgi:hypothetical protein
VTFLGMGKSWIQQAKEVGELMFANRDNMAVKVCCCFNTDKAIGMAAFLDTFKRALELKIEWL